MTDHLTPNPGLPLTEEWLKNCGFDSKQDDSLDYRVVYFKKEQYRSFRVTYDLLNKVFWIVASDNTHKVETVNHLHYLYYAETGRELKEI